MASLFILPGLTVLYIVGGIADRYGIRQGLLVMVPIFVIGALILSSASMFVKADINRVWTSTAAQAEVLYQRSKGEVKLLLVRNVDVSYDNVQVLFGVNFEIDEGEIVALLGTNGAGKSTLLKAIAGVVPADGGAIVFDGRDATYAPPHEIAARGIVMVPGGQGVFPSLTVARTCGSPAGSTVMRPVAPRQWRTRSRCSRPSSVACRSRRPTSAAASSRCSRSRWPCCCAHAC